jgi:uncharacterized protein (TIGR02284 family)
MQGARIQAMDRYDVIKTCNDLIEVSMDGEQGFRACADNVRNDQLKEFFEAKAERCREGAEQLRQIVREMGDEPRQSSSVTGAMHRFWVNLRGTLSGMSENAILDECERGEDYAESAYQDALRHDLTGDVRRVIERQYSEVRANHEKVRELRGVATKA